MSTSPADNPVPGVITFTAQGNAALDQLAASLAAQCDGSPASIADVLQQVLEADIEDLAEAVTETAPQHTTRGSRAGYDASEVGVPAESPDDAARRRLGGHAPIAGGSPDTRGISR